MATYPVSDHCDGARFFNPHAKPRPLSDVITWMRTRERTAWPAHVALRQHAAPPASVPRGSAAVTFIGHSTFLLRTATAAIVTDPVFTSHAGPFGRFGPPRVRPPAIPLDRMPPIDLVLVSHNHYDHLQPSSLRRFADRASYAAPLGVAAQLGVNAIQSRPTAAESHARTDTMASGFPGLSAVERFRKIVELDWWQSAIVGGAEITCVPAQHFSARGPFDRDKTLWCGYVLRLDGVTIYFAGDSGYSPHFAAIGARFPAIDVALLPIGAYEPRWFMAPVHMNPDEAVRAHLDVGARRSVGMHFGTFQLTDEAIDEPIRALERARATHGVGGDAFRVLDFGESMISGE